MATAIRWRGPAACAAAAVVGAFGATAARAQEELPASKLFATLGNTPAMDAWQGKTVRVTGFFGGAGSEWLYVNAVANGVDHTVECLTTGTDPRVASLTRGQPVTVVGTVTRIFHGFTGRFQLGTCSVDASAPAAAEKVAKDAATPAPAHAPSNPPLGEYAVYQGAGFRYQYRFALQPGGRYVYAGSDAGRVTYDARTKVLRFTSGPLQGFVGLYYTQGRNNDEHEPAIALDAEGHVPELSSASNGQYQYAFFRPDGV